MEVLSRGRLAAGCLDAGAIYPMDAKELMRNGGFFWTVPKLADRKTAPIRTLVPALPALRQRM